MSKPEIYENGRYWHNDEGLWHREDGPAIELYNGNKEWIINGKLHREDGPAVEWNNDYKQWWYNGEFTGDSYNGFTQEKFDRYLRELKIKEYW